MNLGAFKATVHPVGIKAASRLGVNLVRHPEYKQYTPDEDPYFKMFLKKSWRRAAAPNAFC